MKERIFKIEEIKGESPYSITWISLDGRLKSKDYRTYDKAWKHYCHLQEIGRHPRISLNLLATELSKIKTSKK